MTWAEFLSSQTFGIILGSVLTAGFTLFVEWRKSVGEQKFHIREKREETYQMMLSTFQSLRNHYLNTKQFDIPDEIYANFEETSNLLKMYASSDIEKVYEKFLDEFEKKYRQGNNNEEVYESAMQCLNELSVIVRKELGIGD